MPNYLFLHNAQLDGNGTEEAEPTEKSPLNGDTEAANEKELEANGANGKEKDADDLKPHPTGLAALIASPKVRIVVGVAVITIIGIVAVIGAWCYASHEPAVEPWVEDTTPRILRLIPAPNHPKNLIRFRSGHGIEAGVWPDLIGEIANLYDEYSDAKLADNKNLTTCERGSAPEGKTCVYPINKIKELCNNATAYGYADGNPCIFIQLNYERLLNFTPQAYTNEELATLPGLPDDLR